MNYAVMVLMAVALLAGSDAHAQMGPGPVDVDKAAACYNPATGEIIVSVNDVDAWFIQSFSESLTGATPVFPGPPSLITDNNGRVGQAIFGGEFTFTDHNLGPVAALGLSLSDLRVFWSPNLGGSPQKNAAVTLCVPELATLSMVLISAGILFLKHRRLRS